MVEVVTQWPGQAAEEVERLITVPVEVGDERHPAHDGAALGLALRPLVGAHDVRRRHRQLLRAPAGLRADRRTSSCPTASRPRCRRSSRPRASSTATSSRAPTARPMELKTIEDWVVERAFKSVPGVADDSGLGGLTMQYQLLLDPATSRRRGPLGARHRRVARRQQRQRRRRLLLAGRTVLLRARPRPAEDARGHRQRRAGGAQRHPGAGQGRGPGGDRLRAAARPVRLQRSGRRRRRRDPDAQGRAGAGGAEARAGEDARAERARPAART